MINKKILKQKGFKYDIVHDEYYYEREDIEGTDTGEGKVKWFGSRKERSVYKQNDGYRCEFLQNRSRIGKIHYDAIRFMYADDKKPVLEIYIQGGAKMSIKKEEVSICDFEPITDSNYLSYMIPTFDTVSFYGSRPIALEMDIKLTELQ